MTNDLLEQLTAIDPHPVDADPPNGAVTAAAVLQELEWRSDMQTLEKQTTSKPPSRWNGAFVAAVAAAAIIIIGVTAAWLTSRGADEPAATTTTEAVTQTTTASDTASSRDPSAAEFGFVSTMGVDLSNGDATRILATIGDETVVPPADGDGPIRSAEDLENFLAYGIALESSWGRGVCTMGAGDVATCELIRWSDSDPYTGVDGQVMLVSLRLDDDRATTFAVEFTTYGSDNWLTRELAFMAWLEDAHPDDYVSLYTRPASDGVWAPDWSDPAMAASLMKQLVPEYLASSRTG